MTDTPTPNADPAAAVGGAPAGTPESVVTGQQAPAGTPPVESSPAPAPLIGGEPKTPEVVPFDAATFEYPTDLGLEFSDADKTVIGDLAKNHGLSTAAVGDILKTYAAQIKSVQEGVASSFNTTQTEWQNAVRAAYKGDALDAVLVKAERILDEFGGPDLRTFLTMSGGGNNLAVIQFLEKVSNSLGEAKPITSGGTPQATDRLAKMYPKMYEGNK